MILTVHDAPTAPALPPSPTVGRAQRLREATNSTHERLDASIMAARPFDSRENYARFLRVQHGFHRDVAGLYHSAELQGLIPDLLARGRFEAVTADAADLGFVPSEAEYGPPASQGMALPEALGWLYVVEGSNLGAAFLYKAALKMGLSADNGARHLAEGPEGRAVTWRGFKAALDAVALSEAEEERAVAGAEAAFARVRELVGLHLAPQPAA